MWSSWTESAKASFQQALEKTGDALEKTGDVLTQSVTHASKSAREASAKQQKQQREQRQQDGSNTNKAVGRYATATETSSTASASASPNLDAASDALIKSFSTGWSSVVESTKAGWQQAQQAMEEQQHRLQQKIAERNLPQPRDLHLPLDVAALQDAQVVYLTDRILTLSHPFLASSTNGEITAERKLAAVGHLLQKRHKGRFMVWNLSEVDYEASLILDNQVMNYSFPGSPSPPLGLLLKLLVSMESWLKADPDNVAVVHCLTGKGRTSTVVAAFLCWMGEAGFDDNNLYDTLAYIAQCKQVASPLELTIPSQRRYAGYFKNMLDNVRPSQPPLLLKRVILSKAPRYARGPGRDSFAANEAEELRWGCAPYLQLFKGGKLVFTAPASLSNAAAAELEEKNKASGGSGGGDDATTKKEDKDSGAAAETTKSTDASESGKEKDDPNKQQPPQQKQNNKNQQLPFCHVGDGSIQFLVDQTVQGDVLIRCRHLTAQRARVSMFRAAFHTGYIGGTVLRLTKDQLDGACSDDRFADDFYMDVIFEMAPTISTAEAQQMLLDSTGAAGAAAAAGNPQEQTTQQPDQQQQQDQDQSSPHSGTTVTATAYDTMLDRDSRFWDVIAKRKQEQQAKEEAAASGQDTAAAESKDPYWGPTVGRRRPLDKEQQARQEKQQKQQQQAGESSSVASPETNKAAAASEPFSIGGELDFLPPEPSKQAAVSKPSVKAKPKRDSLMEALTGALDDDDDHHTNDDDDDVHEVIFIHEDEEKKKAGASTAATSDGVFNKEDGAPTAQVDTTTTQTATSAGTDTQTPDKGGTSATPSEAATATSPSNTPTATAEAQNAPAADQQEAPVSEDFVGDAAAAADQLLSGLGSLSLDDDDVNALLAETDGKDDDDDDLQDLENLLSSAGKK